MVLKSEFIEKLRKEPGFLVKLYEGPSRLGDWAEAGNIKLHMKYKPVVAVPEKNSLLPDFLRETVVDYTVESVHIQGISLSDFHELPFFEEELYWMAKERGMKSVFERRLYKNPAARLCGDIEVTDDYTPEKLVSELVRFNNYQNDIWYQLCDAKKNALKVYPRHSKEE